MAIGGKVKDGTVKETTQSERRVLPKGSYPAVLTGIEVDHFASKDKHPYLRLIVKTKVGAVIDNEVIWVSKWQSLTIGAVRTEGGYDLYRPDGDTEKSPIFSGNGHCRIH